MNDKIAIYLRLSLADGDLKKSSKDESNSIENQRMLLHDYIGKQEDLFGEIVEYVDDGYTGTNFNRPAFQKMIVDLKQGDIKVIVVKDDCVIIEPTQKDLENQGFVAGSICF